MWIGDCGVTWDSRSGLVIVFISIEALQGGLSKIVICQSNGPWWARSLNKSVYLMSIRRNRAKIRDKRNSKIKDSRVIWLRANTHLDRAAVVLSLHYG